MKDSQNVTIRVCLLLDEAIPNVEEVFIFKLCSLHRQDVVDDTQKGVQKVII
jgi:hypothetical protein